MSMADPRRGVEEPVRRALLGLTIQGIGLVALTVCLVVCSDHNGLDCHTRDGITIAIPFLLVAIACLVRFRWQGRGRPGEDARRDAWDRAREVDAADAALALMTTAWTPVATGVLLALMLWPHVTDPNPALAAAWVVLGIPPTFLAWLILTVTWLEASRDRLAAAETEADARLRRYWAHLAGR